jgi:N-acetylated-alpha-linked acidic dipeptidase
MLQRLSLLALIFLLSTSVRSQAPPPIRGFIGGSAAAQREVERRFHAVPDSGQLREYMRAITAEPHHAGSAGSRKVAEYILEKFRSWGLEAEIEEFEALIPYPTERTLQLIAPERFAARLEEPPVEADSDSADAGQLPSFNAYAADGDVTADLVYVNYGLPEDYEQLAKLGVDVRGKIVIARYGRSWRGIKPKVASEHGAVGCIIYSDPKDDGYYVGEVYPAGPFRPEQGVQRGSVMDMPIYPGDPLTPGWASERGGRKLSRAEAGTLLRIPVLPISYGDALPLLRNLRGPLAPESWRGALPITYHVGGGPARVRLKVAFDWQQRPLYNVIARIDGTRHPEQWVIHGNHHDAWVSGASDPTSGTVALMETARGLAEQVKQGWRPKRTIIIAAWDGEEWGLLGSTEWVEKHRASLAANAVAYINSDSTGKGWLAMGGSHSLQAFVNEVARDVPDPRGSARSVLEARRLREIDQARSGDARAKLERGDLRIEALGSGSDYTPFLDHLTISSLNLGFGGDGGASGVYHSAYDSFHWFTRFSDGSFAHTAALSRVIGTALLRLADADVLPFEFGATADTLGRYVDELQTLALEARADIALDPLRRSLRALEEASGRYEAALSRATSIRTDDVATLAALNRTLYSTERAFRHDSGLPRRDWFKHLAYAPGFYTGYGVKTLPAIREGIEQKHFAEAREFVPVVSAAFDRLRAEVEKATSLLNQVSRP